MKIKIFSAFLIAAILISSLTIFPPSQLAQENNEVSNLALMLPDSDIILAIDMHKTLNVVGPNLLNSDEKKIANLKKLMKSLENVIGLDPYEINQIVAGVKLPSVEEKNFFEKVDYTIIFRTARLNDALLESAPQIIEDARSQNIERRAKSEKNAKTMVQSFQNIEEILTSPKFYSGLAQILAGAGRNK